MIASFTWEKGRMEEEEGLEDDVVEEKEEAEKAMVSEGILETDESGP